MSAATTVTAQTSVTAFLVDRLCIAQPGFFAADGANVSSQPERHTVGCAVMPVFIASGFALMTNAAPAGATPFYRPASSSTLPATQ